MKESPKNDTPIIFDTSDGQELRINMISPWLKKYFRRSNDNLQECNVDSCEAKSDGRTLKIVKLSLDGGFTCPNRDGTKGIGGCKFCSESGSGDMASSLVTEGSISDDGEQIKHAIRDQIDLLSGKWPADKYNLRFIAYFQNHTNTYGPVEKLRRLFEAAIGQEGVCGLAVATRPDCLSQETLQLLDELNQKTFLWVELGLQTTHDETAKAMNLCHKLEDYDKAVAALTDRNIRVVTHLILGLPGETREMMLDSVKHVCRDIKTGEKAGENRKVFGIKLHMLNIVKGSAMEVEYKDYIPFETMGDYINLVTEAIEMIPPEITLHRISGDAPRATLIAPEWSYRKRTILNAIHARMKEKNMWQGKRSLLDADRLDCF